MLKPIPAVAPVHRPPVEICMHLDPAASPALAVAEPDHRPWYQLLSRYHWFVFIVCSLGWLFDTMDQQLFNIARTPAVRALESDPSSVATYSGYATSIFLIGWGAGGLFFGVLGDLIGRARSMVITILLYSLFTGLSALSVGFWDFAFYRLLTGLGVGGQFAVGVSLVAEVMPERARPSALGLLQALSAIGNVAAALFGIALAFSGRWGITDIAQSWRYMFLIGTIPALLVLVIMRRLKEPERWSALAAQKTIRERFGAYTGELFSDPRWSRHAIVGLLLASSGIIGLWAIGFFSIDFVREIIRPRLATEQAAALSAQDRQAALKWADTAKLDPDASEQAKHAVSEVKFWEEIWASITSIVLNIGAFFGIYAFSRVTRSIGRRPTFAGAFVLALLSTALVFWLLDSFAQIFWMIPLMGFCQLALFGGYAIYFPELFPTRLRSTGISFCYNGARFVAATGPFVQGHLRDFFKGVAGGDLVQGFRYAGVTMCLIFVLGLLVLPFAPETQGKPLPE
jgi:MFS family permease